MATIEGLLRIYEAVRKEEVNANRNLTDNARAMLVVPIAELLDFNREFVDWNQAQASIADLIKAAEPDTMLSTKMLTSRSIIGAFHTRFCNIPPFCGRVRR